MGLSAANPTPTTREAFLAELATSLDVISTELDVVAIDPASKARERLADRLGVLSVRAAGLDDSLLADELRSCRAIVQGVGVLGRLDASTREQLDGALCRIEAFVRAEMARDMGTARRRRSQVPAGARRTAVGSMKIVVVGSQAIGDSLLAEDWAASDDGPAIAVEHVTFNSMAHHDVAARTPAAVIIDGDDPAARRLVERLMGTGATEEVPILVVGAFARTEDAAPFIALGVARTLAKPASPGELRRTCLDLAPAPATRFEPLGALSVDALGSRLAEELQRGLCDAADGRARSRTIELGAGDEVLTVMWDAIARIRELVTASSKGSVRFAPSGPVDALPRAAWLRGSSRRKPSDRAGKIHEVREPAKGALSGCTIVVAEDDLSTNWFISGVLKEAGAEVHSVYDGHKALDHAYRELPDLILSDVVMPELDGYTLCRAIKRDVLLRSVPVVLLSWKPDLLQRMRELGAGADGYLLKEASSADILHRVQEVLRPHRALAERVAAEGIVRGRLDGMTAHALLKLVSSLRPDARVSLKDAHYLYEIELRGGRPVVATRTHGDGVSERGRDVIAALVGLGDGRFCVSDIDAGAALNSELDGTLDEQLMDPIARARATQALIGGSKLMGVEKVCIDESKMMAQLLSTPEPSRGLLRALARGASPRDLVATGRASSDLLERVVGDAARQGAVLQVLGPRGHDLLPAAYERELAVMSGDADQEVVRASYVALTGAIASEPFAALQLARMDDPPPNREAMDDTESSAPVERVETLPEPTQDDGCFDEAEDDDSDEWDDAPSDLDFAQLVTEERGGIAGPFARRAHAPREARTHRTPVLASAMEVAQHARHFTPILSRVVDDDDGQLARLDDPGDEVDSRAVAPQVVHSKAADVAPVPAVVPAAVPEAPFSNPEAIPIVPRMPMPSAWATRGAEPPPQPKGSRWLWPLVFGIFGVTLAIGARWYREHRPLPQSPPMQLPQIQSPGEAQVPVQQLREQEVAPTRDTRDAEPATELPLTDDEAAALETGQGLAEIVAGRDHEVTVDGKVVGRGPVVKVALDARKEPYEVRVKMDGEERVRYLTVQAGKRLRLRVAPPWSH